MSPSFPCWELGRAICVHGGCCTCCPCTDSQCSCGAQPDPLKSGVRYVRGWTVNTKLAVTQLGDTVTSAIWTRPIWWLGSLLFVLQWEMRHCPSDNALWLASGNGTIHCLRIVKVNSRLFVKPHAGSELDFQMRYKHICYSSSQRWGTL